MSNISIQYVPLDDVEKWPRNPKKHDFDQLRASIRRFGFTSPVIRDEETGKLVAGHGRLESLVMMKADGEDAPLRVQVNADGSWSIPVIMGVAFKNDREAEAYLLADNRQAELGGWDDELLSAILDDLKLETTEATDLLEGTGFTSREVSSLLTEVEKPAIGKTPTEKLSNFLEGAIKQFVVYFEDAEYNKYMGIMKKIQEERQLESMSDALISILDEYEANADAS